LSPTAWVKKALDVGDGTEKGKSIGKNKNKLEPGKGEFSRWTKKGEGKTFTKQGSRREGEQN